MSVYQNIFEAIVSVESLLAAWHDFKRGKRKKPDVAEFELHLEKNIFALHRDLVAGTYKHGAYHGFYIQDPKLRHIHKAEVRDRIIHQSVYTALTKIYDPTFIHHSYSCRLRKGTHKAVEAFEVMSRKISKNFHAPCYVLKCDIKKFFDSIDHAILLDILKRKISDPKAFALFAEIIGSFQGYKEELREHCGIPIGNLTSQIFANIYMNELDQFVKHQLREKYYIRYADDFVILSSDKSHLQSLIPQLEDFLAKKLRMRLHPNKIHLRNFYQGVDFLGAVVFPKHKVLRTKTRQRMLKKLDASFADFFHEKAPYEKMNQVFQSYFRIMGHGNCHKLETNIRKNFWIYSLSQDESE